ncbi:S8 family serine peptidase [Streptomyces sp. B6B3]|uniref:S8 family peptidase n=1 Tax=Streptomyces sp. B6B3 TaxID=3153570 RepID=UPI00325F75D4
MNSSRLTRRALAGIAVAAVALFPGLAAAASPAGAGGGDAAPTTDLIANAGDPGTVPGSYVVLLDDASPAASAAPLLAEEYGGELTHVYRHALNGFAAELSEAEALRLAADPAVELVRQDQAQQVATDVQPNPPSWGLDRLDEAELPLDNAYEYPSHGGAGVDVYVIDTGVHTTHQEFEGRASIGYDAFNDGVTTGYGHGTHVAGTVAGATFGVAKDATVISVRVIDAAGVATTATIAGGVDWVTGQADGPSVANMSLGINADPVLDTAVGNSIAAGVTYVASAGNSGQNVSISSPARVPEVITVGSVDSTDTFAASSNRGPGVDILAPGVQITSADNVSDTASRVRSGTSMAAPHVTGAAALYLADHPTATPQQVRDALVAGAVTGAVRLLPVGTANVLLHTGDESGEVDVPQQPTFTNDTDVPITDSTTVTSGITVSGVPALSGPFYVDVDIEHQWAINLTVELVQPDGTVRVLCSPQVVCDWTEIYRTFTFTQSGLDPNGGWQLRVRDPAAGDTGVIDSWSLRF